LASKRPALTVAQILAWVDAHQQQTGRWPSVHAGPVADAPGLTWQTLDRALRHGRRGLPGGDTLSCLLQLERGASGRAGRPVDACRRGEAVRLRTGGLTLAEIGRRLGGVTPQAVSQLLRRTHARLQQDQDLRA
jgi:hypothetical protein